MFAPCSSNNCTINTCPAFDATISAVFLFFGGSMFAPCSSNNRPTDSCPASEAIISAVYPDRLVALTSVPNSSKIRTTSSRPKQEAACSGRSPLIFCSSRSSPFSMRNWAMGFVDAWWMAEFPWWSLACRLASRSAKRRTNPSLPVLAAMCKVVAPSLEVIFTSAPCCSRNLTIEVCPLLVASNRLICSVACFCFNSDSWNGSWGGFWIFCSSLEAIRFWLSRLWIFRCLCRLSARKVPLNRHSGHSQENFSRTMACVDLCRFRSLRRAKLLSQSLQACWRVWVLRWRLPQTC